MSLIEKLTPEQEALIPVYREKWRAIALLTERIDREKAAKAVKAAYVAIDYEQPKIFFQDSPYAACNWMLKQLPPDFLDNYYEPNSLATLFSTHFLVELSRTLDQQLGNQLCKQLINCLDYLADNPFNNQIFRDLMGKFSAKLVEHYYSWWIKIQLIECCFEPEKLGNSMIGFFDFCISVLNIVHPQQEWKVFQSLIQECGWLFAYDDICIICDRPLHLRFDNQNRLHAEGEPAIEFIDGYSLYSYHGVTLPEKYGKIHPQQ